ncbi:RAD51-associated protein 1-like [Amphibalanus amphitrite]|uniref:RAD51-associated protein 1-like n=1 Tax=Amphibalanus amphitrite TaxID=1232801 RepID=UPI001C9258F4|nr:RAD51-associated protein 1-like [Amphibalanus amphitrite]XP_043190817.1 RAD51-associated protein 1-like [Amphibalanus amphitrite]XP_043190825.1 RAD51-associated protein 1-like [Amphibalanus amphitrite]
MSSRRTRGRAVDYRALADGADSDDDFTVPTPPTKRPRCQKASERAAEFADGAGPSHMRVSLDDKLYQKQLRIALERSRNDCKDSSDSSSQERSVKSADTLPVSEAEMSQGPDTEIEDEITTTKCSPDHDKWTASGSSSSDESESDYTAELSDDEFKPQPKKVAKKPAKATAKKQSTPKAKPTKQRSPVTKRQVSPRAPPRSDGPPQLKAISPVKNSPASEGPPPLTRPVLKAVNSSAIDNSSRTPDMTRAVASKLHDKNPSTPSPSSGRTGPKWKPPARISEGSGSARRLDSPSGGALRRLGLSRNVRLKSLHPSAKPVI